jgi:signal transduction histidine kinase
VLSGRASAALNSLTVRRGRVHPQEAPDQGAVDAQVWVYSGRQAIERPRAQPAVQALARSLVGGSVRYADEPATDTRLYSVPVERGGRRVGTVITALSLEPYERTASRALVASLIFAGATLLLIIAASAWIIGRALRPVGVMTAEAATWSERDLDHRFNAGEPYDELTRLAATFDQMLDRLASSLRREQRFTAELSHELRTPLTAISAEAELALSRDREGGEYRQALEVIRTRTTQLQRILEALLSAARAESSAAPGMADAIEVAERARESCEPLAGDRGITITVTPPRRPLRVAADLDTAERILAPLLENACRYGHRAVSLSVSGGPVAVEFRIADDGPGIGGADREGIFEPGVRGASAGNGLPDDAGVGLGLALARRLARAVGGDVEYAGNSGGAVFVARVPFG